MNVTYVPSGYVVRWLSEYMPARAQNSMSLTQRALNNWIIEQREAQELCRYLQRMVNPQRDLSPFQWQILLRQEAIKTTPQKRGPHFRYLFVVTRVEGSKTYTPSQISKLITESDAEVFREKYFRNANNPLSLNQLQTKARSALCVHRKRYIKAKPTIVVIKKQGEMKGWTGNQWLSSFNLLTINNLHCRDGMGDPGGN